MTFHENLGKTFFWGGCGDLVVNMQCAPPHPAPKKTTTYCVLIKGRKKFNSIEIVAFFFLKQAKCGLLNCELNKISIKMHGSFISNLRAFYEYNIKIDFMKRTL